MKETPIAIIGAGAAGLMLASFLRLQKKTFVLFESQKQVGQKILVSGGGHCNILPSQMSLDDFESYSSKKNLQRVLMFHSLTYWKDFFEKELGIPLKKEMDTGKFFPQSHSAKQLLKQWLDWLKLTSQELYLNHRLTNFRRDSGRYLLNFSDELWACEKLVLATGGFSYPKTGSDGTGWRLLEKYVPMYEPVPALAPLVAENSRYFSISGYSLPVHSQAFNPEKKLIFESRAPLLFTHFGYSGPAAMDLAFTLKFPDVGLYGKLLGKDRELWKKSLEEYPANKSLLQFLSQHFSRAFSEILLEEIDLVSNPLISQVRKEFREKLYSLLGHFPLQTKKTQGFTRAEVTSGGLDLSEISLNTMEVKALPRCYVIGELLDCTGRIGGYNFLWAFSSAAVASRGLLCS